MNREALKEAVKQVQALLDESDAGEMLGQRQPPASPMGEGMEGGEAMPAGCAECEAGTCSDPEHASEDDLSAMMEG